MWRWIGLLVIVLMLIPAGLEAQGRRGGGGGGRGSSRSSSSSSRSRGPASRPAPATKPAPIVAVTKTDNTIVRGTILSTTPDEIFFQPAPKAGEHPATQPSADDFITIDWKEVLRVSNGLTRQKALDQWKDENRDNLCLTCFGDRVVWCSICKGTGHDPASAANCLQCKGAMVIACTNTKCKDGNEPCPNGCLKLTEGTWYTKPDGTKWRKFPTGTGYIEFSEHHVGDLIVHEGNTWTDKGKCPVCGGLAQIVCPVCHGTSKVPCPTCIGRKDAPVCTNSDCEKGLVTCPTCKGTGLKPGPTTTTASLLYDLDPQS